MKLMRLCFGLPLALGTIATLQAQNVKVDYDKNLSFEGFKTYTRTQGTPAKNSLWDQRIKDGVDKQLAAKGFRKVDANSNPDLIESPRRCITVALQKYSSQAGRRATAQPSRRLIGGDPSAANIKSL